MMSVRFVYRSILYDRVRKKKGAGVKAPAPVPFSLAEEENQTDANDQTQCGSKHGLADK